MCPKGGGGGGGNFLRTLVIFFLNDQSRGFSKKNFMEGIVKRACAMNYYLIVASRIFLDFLKYN